MEIREYKLCGTDFMRQINSFQGQEAVIGNPMLFLIAGDVLLHFL